MSGVRKIQIEDIVTGGLKGRALSDALAKAMNSQEVPKTNQNGKRKNK